MSQLQLLKISRKNVGKNRSEKYVGQKDLYLIEDCFENGKKYQSFYTVGLIVWLTDKPGEFGIQANNIKLVSAGIILCTKEFGGWLLHSVRKASTVARFFF